MERSRLVSVSFLGLLLLAGCGSAPAESTQSTPAVALSQPPTVSTDSAATPPPQVAPATSATPTAIPTASSGDVIDFTDSSGDAVTVAMKFGQPVPFNDDTSWSSAAVACDADDRTAVVSVTMTVTLTSSLAGSVEVNMGQDVVGFANPLQVNAVTAYSDGPVCTDQTGSGDFPSVEWSDMAPNAPGTFTLYLLYLDAITPEYPTGDPSQLTTVEQEVAALVSGQGLYVASASGPQVIPCGFYGSPGYNGESGPTSAYVMPAGPLPSSTTNHC